MREFMQVKLMVLFLFIILSGCSSVQKTEPATHVDGASNQTQSNEIPFSRRVYFLQHKVIPKWLFDSDGTFYREIKAGNIDGFVLRAADIVGQHYANEVVFTPIDGNDAVLITFPEPTSAANCFFALLQRDNNVFTYTTYEKSIDLFGLGDEIVGVVGGWNAEGGHENFGPRGYKTSTEFVNDILSQP